MHTNVHTVIMLSFVDCWCQTLTESEAVVLNLENPISWHVLPLVWTLLATAWFGSDRSLKERWNGRRWSDMIASLYITLSLSKDCSPSPETTVGSRCGLQMNSLKNEDTAVYIVQDYCVSLKWLQHCAQNLPRQ